eukprot:Clim_evm40s146 gene=Clim_evmTU40s146
MENGRPLKRQRIGGPEVVTPIQKLPDETLHHIFSYLDVESLLNCSEVSRDWARVAKTSSLWSRCSITLSDSELSKNSVLNKAVSNFGAQIEAIEHLELRSPIRGDVWFQNDMFSSMIEVQEPENDGFIETLRSGLCNLKTFEADGAAWMGKTQELIAILEGCNSLETVRLDNAKCLTTTMFEVMCENNPDLHTVSLNNTNVLDSGLHSLTESDCKLREVNLNKCISISLDMLEQFIRKKGKYLERLSIASHEIGLDLITLIKESCPNLKELDVRYCTNLLSVDLQCLDGVTVQENCALYDDSPESIRAYVDLLTRSAHVY